MVSIQVIYEGDLHCIATHEPSADQLTTDAPVDNQGRGETFSPTDLVATALGTCMATTLDLKGRAHGWDFTGARVAVKKHMRADPVRRIGKLEVEIHIPRDHSPEDREAIQEIALTCPVQMSVHPDIDVPVSFHWGASDS